MRNFFKLISIALMLIIFLSSCSINKKDIEPLSIPIVKTNFLMGTIVEVKIYDNIDDSIITKAFNRISEIEEKMTINNAETSEIIRLNNNAGNKETELSSDTFYVLQKGLHYSHLSQGAFDITIGPLVKLWNIGTDSATVPQNDLIDETLRLIDYKKLSINPSIHIAMLQNTNMKVDLGAIAKGYAADEAARILRDNGVEHAILYLGGNLLTIGRNPNGSPWKIGIQDPFSNRGDFMGIVNIDNKSVVTSGTYERFFEKNGKKYHHIINPKTGYPVENNLSSVSIISDKSIDGDGLSTTLLLLGLKEGRNVIESLSGIEAVFITNDKKVYLSSGLDGKLQITKSEFKLD